MTDKQKKFTAIALMLAIWLLAADAYWVSKERAVSRCVIDKSTELVSRNLSPEYFRNIRINFSLHYFHASLMVKDQCSFKEGTGYYWNELKSMAYWEILLTLPVIYRYRFD